MRRTLSKAIKAASSPEARAKAVATMKRNREAKLRAQRETTVRSLGQVDGAASSRLELASRLLSILDRLV